MFHRRTRATIKTNAVRVGQFRSKFESKLADALTERGIEWEYEKSKLKYTRECEYTPDFEIETPSGRLYIETKGWFKPADRTKMLAVKNANPGVRVCMVFMNAKTRLYSGSPTTYAMWCDKHGFPWSERTIKAEWLR